MDEYYRAISNLPEPLYSELKTLNPNIAPYVQEIRLRENWPLLFVVKGQLTECGKLLPDARQAVMIDRKALEKCFIALCRHSVYAYEDEIKQGYLTAIGGDRVGLAGVRGLTGFARVTSLNLRVARRLLCTLPPQIMQILDELSGGILVAGAPGSGKTTFLRSMLVHLCKANCVCSVIDERSELTGANTQGFPPGCNLNCDVYTQYPKTEAIEMALRCMNPQVIICDELAGQADAKAVESALSAGVVFLASVHCTAPGALESKPQIARLIQTGAFQSAVFLDGRDKPGTVARMVAL